LSALAATSTGDVLAIEGVTKEYGGMPVLRGVNLRVPRGCLYGLIGPGASGKSVLLKMITGLVRPDEGRVLVEGRDVNAMNELELQQFRASFGMLFQNNALFDYLNVADNIAFPLRRMTQQSEPEIAARIAERLKAVSLPGFEGRTPAGLSGGQKKRIGFARATVLAAPIVLYDEPAAGLDPVTSQRIFELAEAGAAIARSVADDWSTPSRPRWVLGSVGPGTKLPSLGHAPYATLRDAYQQQLDAAGHGTISTEIAPAPEFFYAEDDHQQYLSKNPGGYCGLGGTGVSCPVGLST
jgi:phospholipid/cholesterol/gamma-HCH transport system ATP-binding protein